MKKRLSILAVLLLAITVTAYSVSGTYAKYTSNAAGTSTARVAKWAFQINDNDVTNSFTFNLFDTLKEATIKALNDKTSEVILFSPMFASYDQYKSYEERGKEFNYLIKKHFDI